MRLINPEIRIENCSKCNSRCTICPREKMTRPQVIMDNDHFEWLVWQGKELGANTVSIFGYGEPLLDPGIIDKVRFCTDHDLKTFITTNGSLLNLEMAKALIDAGLWSIRFSVHGNYKTYDAVHRGLNFATTIRNIMNFRAVARGKVKTSVSVIPMHEEKVETLKEVWGDFDLEIWKPHNWTDGREYRDLTKRRKKTCGRPFNGPVQINADGMMMVCCFDFDAKMVVGDTHKQTIEEILKGYDFEFIRNCHRFGHLYGLPCETCDQLNIGDNPLIYSTIDPSCEIGKTSSTKFNLEEKTNGLHTNKKRNYADSSGACCT